MSEVSQEKIRWFHYKDGIYFHRLPNGSVKIIKMKNALSSCNEIELELNIDKDGWASIVASVSAIGEDGERFGQALEFHMKEPLLVSNTV